MLTEGRRSAHDTWGIHRKRFSTCVHTASFPLYRVFKLPYFISHACEYYIHFCGLGISYLDPWVHNLEPWTLEVSQPHFGAWGPYFTKGGGAANADPRQFAPAIFGALLQEARGAVGSMQGDTWANFSST